MITRANNHKQIHKHIYASIEILSLYYCFMFLMYQVINCLVFNVYLGLQTGTVAVDVIVIIVIVFKL